MLRPWAQDVFWSLFPLAVGAAAFAVGSLSFRWPRKIRYGLIAFALTVTAVTAAAAAAFYFGTLVPARAEEAAALVGGPAVILDWAALFLLGVVWDVPGRRWSSGFLAFLCAAAGALLLTEAGACLWWRWAAPGLSERTFDAGGGLTQSTGLTCSPAAAAMLLHRYGVKASEGEMAYLANTSLCGKSEYQMARALTVKVGPLGWRAEVQKAVYQTLVALGQPCLAHVQPPGIGPHIIFLQRAGPDYVLVIDSLEGFRKKMPRRDFEDVWVGTTILLCRAR
jgi:hypothetical protein